jgi:dTDP-4-dehydrorhamnose reductase
MMMVSGANGLVGSRVVARLARSDEPVLAVGRGAPRVELGPRVEYVDVDLRRPEALRELIQRKRPAGVIHCAAMTDVDACERAPAEAWIVNVRATEQAALGCAAAGARLVALSTDYVFDGEAGRAYAEDDVPNPRGAYARTKLCGEVAALVLAPDVAVARLSTVYSGRPGVKRTFAAAAAEALLAGREVKAFVDQTVSPTLADDAAAMAIGLFARRARGTWHCSGGSAVTRVEFCRALARKLGADERLVVPVPLASAHLAAPRPRFAALRVDKVRRLLGDSVALPLDAQLDRFAAERNA